jgi:regulatory protein
MNPHESSAESSRQRARARAPLDRTQVEKWALGYAARWETSQAGVQTHLERKIRTRCEETGENPQEFLDHIPEIIDAIVEHGYVDDRRFAETTIDRMRRQGRSRAQIEARLRAKGISTVIRNDLLNRPNEHAIDLESAWRLARRRALGPFCSDREKRNRDRNRHLAILARQGFDQRTAEQVIDAESPPEPC